MSSGTDKIVSSIMSEAQEKADVIIQEVNAEVSAIQAKADKTAEVEKTRILENGNPKVKALAKYIAPDVLDDGIYQVMVNEGLIKPLE